MDQRLRLELETLLNNHFAGTPDHEMREVLEAIDEVIEEHGLVPSEPLEDVSVDEED